MFRIIKLSLFFIFIVGFYTNSFAQFSITGIVTNEQGEHLKYASVYLEGTSHGTTSDEKGNYLLDNIPTGTYNLKVTFLSYKAYDESIELDRNEYIDIVLLGNAFELEALEVIANRVSNDNPIAHSNINKEEIKRNNFSKDIPVLLQNTPSVVMTSDAGNGVGYTSMRIRGFDITRINVNINGVPLNDAESQAVFFVDIPDLLSNTEDIQIQRGVGSSTNGPGAFGASVSLNTKSIAINPYAEIGFDIGSYATNKISGAVGTGLMNDKYSVDFRYSVIRSDGYLDRATSKLKSYYFSAAKLGNHSSLRFISFSGHERTYQAWYGTPKEKLFGTDQELLDHYNRNKGSIYKDNRDSVNLFTSDRKYNYYTYPTQVDDYTQTHYQLHYSKEWSKHFQTQMAVYSSLGKGYYREFKRGVKFADYFIPDIVLDSTTIFKKGNLVRHRNLNNILYGGFLNSKYSKGDQEILVGLAASTYRGDHFGNVVKTIPETELEDKNYYESIGNKDEFSVYAKYEKKFNKKWFVFLDLQYRYVGYKTAGTDNDQQHFDIHHQFNFFNPKLGMSYLFDANSSINFFAGISNREPTRNDFVDVIEDATPLHENIQDYELSYRLNTKKLNFNFNTYYMSYNNQLVLRGDLNDVGASIRVNVDKSYRAGMETSISYQLLKKLGIGGNLTYSQNKINSFKEHIFSYDIGESVETIYENTDISFSPDFIGNINLRYDILKNWNIRWDTRYVSQQYLDNTSSDNKAIEAYTVSDISTSYEYKGRRVKSLLLSLRLSNVFNTFYVSNGYTYSYIWGEKITESFYYPQAERNYSISMKIKF